MKSHREKDSFKERSKRVKALELEKTKADRVIATHEATIQDLHSRLYSTEATLPQLHQELSHVHSICNDT